MFFLRPINLSNPLRILGPAHFIQNYFVFFLSGTHNHLSIMVQIIATIEGTRLTIRTAKNEQVFKIFETVHTKKSFDFYPTRVTFLKINLGVGLYLQLQKNYIRYVSWCRWSLQIVFFISFKKRKNFISKVLGPRTRSGLDRFMGASFPAICWPCRSVAINVLHIYNCGIKTLQFQT